MAFSTLPHISLAQTHSYRLLVDIYLKRKTHPNKNIPCSLKRAPAECVAWWQHRLVSGFLQILSLEETGFLHRGHPCFLCSSARNLTRSSFVERYTEYLQYMHSNKLVESSPIFWWSSGYVVYKLAILIFIYTHMQYVYMSITYPGFWTPVWE